MMMNLDTMMMDLDTFSPSSSSSTWWSQSLDFTKVLSSASKNFDPTSIPRHEHHSIQFSDTILNSSHQPLTHATSIVPSSFLPDLASVMFHFADYEIFEESLGVLENSVMHFGKSVEIWRLRNPNSFGDVDYDGGHVRTRLNQLLNGLLKAQVNKPKVRRVLLHLRCSCCFQLFMELSEMARVHMLYADESSLGGGSADFASNPGLTRLRKCVCRWRCLYGCRVRFFEMFLFTACLVISCFPKYEKSLVEIIRNVDLFDHSEQPMVESNASLNDREEVGIVGRILDAIANVKKHDVRFITIRVSDNQEDVGLYRVGHNIHMSVLPGITEELIPSFCTAVLHCGCVKCHAAVNGRDNGIACQRLDINAISSQDKQAGISNGLGGRSFPSETEGMYAFTEVTELDETRTFTPLTTQLLEGICSYLQGSETEAPFQNSPSVPLHSDLGPMVETGTVSDVVASVRQQNGSKTPLNGAKKIHLKDIRQYHGKITLVEAAKHLGISRSTLKRRCRELGILKWNAHEINRDEHSPSVTVKATFGAKMLKFDLPFSSKMEELESEVKKRVPSGCRSFSIQYRDKDGDLIWVTCDDDWQYCMHSFGPQATIEILIEPISEW